jgi:hypothetical protein
MRPRIYYGRLLWAVVVYGFLGLILASFIGGVVECSVLLITTFRSDEAWPGGVVLGMIILYFLWKVWRYNRQREEERRRLYDEMKRNCTFYY